MYLGASPGNFQQLSFYDARRGELYRDFADPIGVAARTVVEGLFGIHPKALDGELHIRPGLPADWDHASFESPDIRFAYRRAGLRDSYEIEPYLGQTRSEEHTSELKHIMRISYAVCCLKKKNNE